MFLEIFERSGKRLKKVIKSFPEKFSLIALVSYENIGPINISTPSLTPFSAAVTAPSAVPLVCRKS